MSCPVKETVFVLLVALLVWQAGAIWRAISSGAEKQLPGAVDPGEVRHASGSRLVAVGDLHGDMAQALRVLQLGGLVDASGNWSTGKTTLVQVRCARQGPVCKMFLLNRPQI